MPALYPNIEPYDCGMLGVGNGHHVYWETCGKPTGKPVVVLHGGPGSGCSERARRYFNPDLYRVVLFDQRGCGRSTPHASNTTSALAANTTDHLLADIELLRRHLGIDRWLIFGASWGSTLALAYAERHPHRVSGMVLLSVATTTRWEIDWITRGLGILFPEPWERFRDGVPAGERDGSLVEAYHRLLMAPDSAIHEKAARDWCDWEMALVAVHPNHTPNRQYERPEFRLAFARIVTHYWRHNAWLEDGVLLREVGRLSRIPGVLIHGRLDLGSPLAVPWGLARSWPGSGLVVIGGAGHDARDPGMADSVVATTDRFAASR